MSQIRIEPNGFWHRREGVGHEKTVCGWPIYAFESRDEGNDHLCPGCFTPHEINTAEIELVKIEHADDARDYPDIDDEEPTDPTGSAQIKDES